MAAKAILDDANGREIDSLRARLLEVQEQFAEAQELLDAIRSGEVDAIVVSSGKGDKVFTLEGADYSYRALVEAMNEGAAMLGVDGTLLYCNQYLSDLLLTPLEQVIGRSYEAIIHDKAKTAFEALLHRAWSEGAARSEIELCVPDAKSIPTYISLRKMKAENATALCMVVTDLTEPKNAAAKLAKMSYHDPLTDLPNRRMLMERLAAWWSEAAGSCAALLFLDIDNFKTVNDSLGHDVGDNLLRQIARRVSGCIGSTHLVARLGGDEFVVFCENTPIEQAEKLAGSLVKCFEDPFLLGGQPFRTTTSIGIAPVSPTAPEDTAEPMRAADLAMYAAKQSGGNRAMVFEAPDHERVLRKLLLEQGLFLALEREELLIEYQPQFSPKTGELAGFESLLRWIHPVYGRIAPLEFIPLAEKSGQIVPIGAWVLRESLLQIKRWHKLFHKELAISVNVSPLQVCRDDFSAMVEQVLVEVGVPSAAVRLEVTESIFLQDTAVLHLEQVRALGLKISVDDFGTGYSALGYLQRLPIDEVKLDKSLLDGIVSDPRKMALFGAIVHMAHTLEFTVVAEGVETKPQWDYLTRTGCDWAQGYLLARPLPTATIEERFLGRELPVELRPACGKVLELSGFDARPMQAIARGCL